MEELQDGQAIVFMLLRLINIKKKMNRTYKNLIAALFLFIGTIAHAQTPGFTDDVQDVPIDSWILPMLLMGMLLILLVARNKQNTIKKK